ncbi:class I SAM-dependent DNA methyltransferase [Roseovarius aquimarinus]|uniref:Class I SAM-dependent DNA methyltransferase n=1 Tax=Roseovarius aquimarinus TaxID=1229156 RepID=A0ABW7I7Y0_9RHOB
MTARLWSSGDLIVDRRLDYAEALAEAGDLDAAAELLHGALRLAPGWAAGWFRLGEWCEAAGRAADAIAAWDAALAADPADRLGAGPKRDLARRVPLTETMPAAFVEALFDQYAPGFEDALVGRLDYRAPELLRAALGGPARRYARALDLGCGTGLAGLAVRDICDWLGGCDISEGMLREAAAKGIYDRLERRDLGRLGAGPERYDLILAADVFTYLGALERIIGWCAGALAPGGVLAFTVEACQPGEAPLTLRASRRFAHARAHVEAILRAAGFVSVEIAEAVLRKDAGEDIAGLVIVAGGLTAPRARQGDGEDAVPA